MAFNPHAFLAHRERYPSYRNVINPERQRLPMRCDDNCDCHEASTTCPCVINKTTCDDSCKCQKCQRRYPPCDDSGCDDRKCGCLILGRQCEKGRCACTCCHNNEGSHRLPLVQVKSSSIQGRGLFARYDILKGTYIGEYYGKIVKMDAPEEDPRVTRFRYNKNYCIEPKGDCKMAFINHQRKGKANARFMTFETANGREIRVYAKRIILRGREITVDYGLVLDDDSKTLLCRLLNQIPVNVTDQELDKGHIIEPGIVVRVNNGVKDDWFALIEDTEKRMVSGKKVVYLHGVWLAKDPNKTCALVRTTQRDEFNINCVNGVIRIGKHSALCSEQDVWCWGRMVRVKEEQEQRGTLRRHGIMTPKQGVHGERSKRVREISRPMRVMKAERVIDNEPSQIRVASNVNVTNQRAPYAARLTGDRLEAIISEVAQELLGSEVNL